MIKLIKSNKGLKTEVLPKEYESAYKLVKDDKTIGFGTINNDKENALYIYINEEERGNGYGKILFSKMLDQTKSIGCDRPQITFAKENIPMTKIAVDNGGTLISSDGETVKYRIPTK